MLVVLAGGSALTVSLLLYHQALAVSEFMFSQDSDRILVMLAKATPETTFRMVMHFDRVIYSLVI